MGAVLAAMLPEVEGAAHRRPNALLRNFIHGVVARRTFYKDRREPETGISVSTEIPRLPIFALAFCCRVSKWRSIGNPQREL